MPRTPPPFWEIGGIKASISVFSSVDLGTHRLCPQRFLKRVFGQRDGQQKLLLYLSVKCYLIVIVSWNLVTLLSVVDKEG